MRKLLIIFFSLFTVLASGQRFPFPTSAHLGESYSNAYYTAYHNAMTSPWQGDTAIAFNDMLDSLDNDDYLDSMYVFYMFASTSKGDALINVANPGTYDADDPTAVDFTRLRYVEGDSAAGNYLSTNFNPSTAGVPRNDITLGVGIANNLQDQDYVFGAGTNIRFRPRSPSDLTRLHINSTNYSAYGHSNSIGHWYLSRPSSSTQTHILNGSQVDTESDASTGVQDAELLIFAWTAPPAQPPSINYQVTYFFVMNGSVNATKAADIKEDIEAFLDYIGGGIE